MDEIPKLETGETKDRWLTAIKAKAFDSIRNLVVLETQAEHFPEGFGERWGCRTLYIWKRE